MTIFLLRYLGLHNPKGGRITTTGTFTLAGEHSIFFLSSQILCEQSEDNKTVFHQCGSLLALVGMCFEYDLYLNGL